MADCTEPKYVELNIHDSDKYVESIRLLANNGILLHAHILDLDLGCRLTVDTGHLLSAQRILKREGVNHCTNEIGVLSVASRPGELLRLLDNTKDIVRTYQGEFNSIAYATKSMIEGPLCLTNLSY